MKNKAPNKWYWVNTFINDEEKGQIGKMVGAEPTQDPDIFILHGTRKYDDSWDIDPAKLGWFLKEELSSELKFYEFPKRSIN